MFAFAILLLGITFVSAADYSGDGTYTVKINDTITADNGWKIEISTIASPASGPWIAFKTYNPEEDKWSYESLSQYVGRKKFGSESTLKLEIELINISNRLELVSATYATYEQAKINVVTIDEKLPGTVSTNDSLLNESIEKEFTYKDAIQKNLKPGEKLTLNNGYIFRFDRFMQGGSAMGSPIFSFYGANGTLIDDGLAFGKGVGGTFGAYIQIRDYNSESVSLLVIEGSKINFGTGWNLFSIPLEDGDGYGTILESTCNEAIVWSWNNELKDYENLGRLIEGTKLPTNKGLWVKIQTKPNWISDSDCGIIVSGTKGVTTQGQRLKAGWNLIGSPISSFGNRVLIDGGSKFNQVSFKDILGDCRIEKGPWQYVQSDTIQHNQFDVADKNKYSAPFENKIRFMRGYFIKVIDDCTLGEINNSETSTIEENTPSLTGIQKYTIMKDMGGYIYSTNEDESYSLYGLQGRNYNKATYYFNNQAVVVFVNTFDNDSVRVEYKNRIFAGNTNNLIERNYSNGQVFYEQTNWADPQMHGFFWEYNDTIVELGSFKSDNSLFEAYMTKYS